MTKEELENLIPCETMVYAKRDNVGYTFMGTTQDGLYQLCGVPCVYADYIMMDGFKLTKI